MHRNGEKRIMGRVTRRVEEDGVKAIYINEKSGEDFECFLENEYGYKTVDKLAGYEDIIDDPEKLKIIDELYLERSEEVNRLKAELTEYKKLEGKGLLLQLPCREVFESNGDTVYYIFDYEIAECINCGIYIDCDGKMWIALACDEHIFPHRNPDPEHDLDPTDWCINTTQVTIDEWGKTVFLTKEEAEEALERMKEVQA